MTARFVTAAVLVDTARTAQPAGQLLRPTKLRNNTDNTVPDIVLAHDVPRGRAAERVRSYLYLYGPFLRLVHCCRRQV